MLVLLISTRHSSRNLELNGDRLFPRDPRNLRFLLVTQTRGLLGCGKRMLIVCSAERSARHIITKTPKRDGCNSPQNQLFDFNEMLGISMAWSRIERCDIRSPVAFVMYDCTRYLAERALIFTPPCPPRRSYFTRAASHGAPRPTSFAC